MSKNYVIGFPRIGEQRELKRVLEEFWAKKCSFEDVLVVAKELKKRHWEYQKSAGVEFISSNDFSLYDNMLDTSIMLGAIPKRFERLENEELYFAMARGNSDAVAMEMTKWFNTNYHYIVPELSIEDNYTLNASKIIAEFNGAKELGIKTKINIIGPLTYLGLSKRVDRGDVYELWNKIVPVYEKLLETVSALYDEITIQIDEPIFVKGLDAKVLSLIKPTYDRLCKVSSNIKIAVV
ncbi:MAG: 5-methyltetrahydropteroyltriglutamate--homocysteine S-methyltransferase, partial [Sulfurimonas sp.]